MRSASIRSTGFLFGWFVTLVFSPLRGEAAEVFLNELTIRPAGMSESVELYNAGADTVIAGWTIQGNQGTFVVPSPGFIPQGGYVTYSVGDIQYERGGLTSLIDLVGTGKSVTRTVRDAVSYGQSGSAPLPPAGMSLCRAPDASAGTPPPPDPFLDGLVWTIDPTPTFDSENDAPPPLPGQSVRLNELDPGLPGGGDSFELFNPLGAPTNLAGWFLINGDGIQILNGIVPAGGFLLLATIPGFDLEEVGLLYLFQPDGVRVDQLGFHDAPELGETECYARCPDGAPPYLGFNYVTSGGGDTFVPRTCTLGESNARACGETPVENLRWGGLKTRFTQRQ